MPILGGLLVTLFGGLAGFFVQFMSRKVAIAAAFTASLGVAIVALLTVFRTLIGPLLSALFSIDYGGWLALAFPPVTGPLLATCVSCWSACTLYAWQRESLRLAVAA